MTVPHFRVLRIVQSTNNDFCSMSCQYDNNEHKYKIGTYYLFLNVDVVNPFNLYSQASLYIKYVSL